MKSTNSSVRHNKAPWLDASHDSVLSHPGGTHLTARRAALDDGILDILARKQNQNNNNNDRLTAFDPGQPG